MQAAHMNRRDFLKLSGAGAAALVLPATGAEASGGQVTAGAVAASAAQGDTSMRREIELRDGWRFQPDPWGEGEGRRYFAADFNTSAWRPISVPRAFDTCAPGLEFYEGKGWYRTSFRAADAWALRRVVLRFEGVNYRCRVWLNGELLGENLDGFLPFEFAIHRRLRIGQDNVLTVLADNARRPGEVPGIQRGWRNSGGILREVRLRTTGNPWIDDIHVIAEPQGRGGTVKAQMRLAIEGPQGPDLLVAGEVLDATGQVVARLAGLKLRMSGSANVDFAADVADVTPWSPATPALYTLRVSLMAGADVIDRTETRFGFRRIEKKGTQLLLNGRPVFLTGFNRHEDLVRAGMCSDLETAKQDLLAMKQAGCNFVRLCHYPHHPGELDLCDELGLLVMDEIPLWQWDQNKEDAEANAAKLAAARRQLERMIARDRNHPSIIFWSVSNECYEMQPLIRAGNEQLIRRARELDPTRLVTHVAGYFWAERAFEEDDVICFNGYPNIAMWGVKPGAARDPNRPGDYFRAMIDELHEKYPDKPIMVTEFGHPCLEGVMGAQFGEDRQAQVFEDAFAGIDGPWCCGACIWCYADHAWPPDTSFHGIVTSPFGAVTRDRKPKRGMDVARRMFSERQRRWGEGRAPAGGR
jgi:beta-galactosidase/beta-glucuronidase